VSIECRDVLVMYGKGNSARSKKPSATGVSWAWHFIMKPELELRRNSESVTARGLSIIQSFLLSLNAYSNLPERQFAEATAHS